MAQQIRVLEKNVLDLSNGTVSITSTDDVASNQGSDFTDLLRDRKNTSGWSTTGSDDTATTVLESDFGSSKTISKIILVLHNFLDYTIEVYNGSSWSTVETVVGSDEATSYYSFPPVLIYKVRITITATQVADADKSMTQLIVTDGLKSGQFEGFPTIKNFKTKTNKKVITMLSGKAAVSEGVGAAELEFAVKNWKNDNDLDLLEAMYGNKEGFLISISGGDEEQFSSRRIGYRLEDIYFMRLIDDLQNDFYKSLYSSGLVVKAKLREAVL